MKNLITILVIILFSNLYSQNNISDITEDALKLYVKDTLKHRFNDGDYIAVSVYSETLYIETLDRDFELYKKTKNYKWFMLEGKLIIIFCDLKYEDNCNNYFNRFKLTSISNSNKILLDEESNIYKLDGEKRLWRLSLDKNNNIVSINGRLIEAEIANPKGFKKFLRKYSKLLLYQMDENGAIVYPKPYL
ncbi:hypothetical protein LPB90_12680 [Chryseobacterium sp. LC2016-29]|uniref:hypothetical protein n=1 Tax=Chryseobacterium sp. LC2016-29 TaxID=2897331 RepID=UPI001E2FAF71|nr:hypothetical protein [Chryseobacterium sp. LC2016-29]MCD0479314.1 hypothetical protein [Chryseobacterium sp. LC2016-29]